MTDAILAPAVHLKQAKTLDKIELARNAVLWLLLLVTPGLAITNAVMNMATGAAHGSTVWTSTLTAIQYGLSDGGLLILGAVLLPRWLNRALCWLALMGAFSLTLFAGVSFGLRDFYHHNQGQEIQLLKEGIEADRAAWRKYHNLETSRRIERREQKLLALMEAHGGRGVSAAYHWIAQAIGYPVQTVTLFMRSLWTFVLSVMGMSLMGLLCEWVGLDLKESVREMGSRAGAAPRKQRSPTKDTQTSGEATSRYEEIRELVSQGELKPSVRSFKARGMGGATAQQYLRALEGEGVIGRNGQGYYLTA
jgi:hypothetical protein